MKAPRHQNNSLNTNNTKYLAHVYQDLNSLRYHFVRVNFSNRSDNIEWHYLLI